MVIWNRSCDSEGMLIYQGFSRKEFFGSATLSLGQLVAGWPFVLTAGPKDSRYWRQVASQRLPSEKIRAAEAGRAGNSVMSWVRTRFDLTIKPDLLEKDCSGKSLSSSLPCPTVLCQFWLVNPDKTRIRLRAEKDARVWSFFVLVCLSRPVGLQAYWAGKDQLVI